MTDGFAYLRRTSAHCVRQAGELFAMYEWGHLGMDVACIRYVCVRVYHMCIELLMAPAMEIHSLQYKVQIHN